ncbi:MAG: DUF3108 domain-containing protein [Bryobacteraceae bacterium]
MMWTLLWLMLLDAAPPGSPVSEETLNYSVNWPSGLSLGEASFRARRAGERWELEFELEAALPGFAVRDRYRSVASGDFCAVELEKQFRHGARKGHERTGFDAKRGVAVRETLGGGGKSEVPAPGCPRDALGFLYYVRRELGQGRLPAPQEIFFGARYQVSVEYRGLQTVRVNEIPMQADRFQASVKGSACEHSFEVFFARDAARTPVLVRVPFPMGVFSMELVR